jgi:hypothetical protein
MKNPRKTMKIRRKKNTRKENLSFKMNVKILRRGSWRRKYIVAWDVRKKTIYGV